jgi:hypothetical protein
MTTLKAGRYLLLIFSSPQLNRVDDYYEQYEPPTPSKNMDLNSENPKLGRRRDMDLNSEHPPVLIPFSAAPLQVDLNGENPRLGRRRRQTYMNSDNPPVLTPYSAPPSQMDWNSEEDPPVVPSVPQQKEVRQVNDEVNHVDKESFSIPMTETPKFDAVLGKPILKNVESASVAAAAASAPGSETDPTAAIVVEVPEKTPSKPVPPSQMVLNSENPKLSRRRQMNLSSETPSRLLSRRRQSEVNIENPPPIPTTPSSAPQQQVRQVNEMDHVDKESFRIPMRKKPKLDAVPGKPILKNRKSSSSVVAAASVPGSETDPTAAVVVEVPVKKTPSKSATPKKVTFKIPPPRKPKPVLFDFLGVGEEITLHHRVHVKKIFPKEMKPLPPLKAIETETSTSAADVDTKTMSLSKDPGGGAIELKKKERRPQSVILNIEPPKSASMDLINKIKVVQQQSKQSQQKQKTLAEKKMYPDSGNNKEGPSSPCMEVQPLKKTLAVTGQPGGTLASTVTVNTDRPPRLPYSSGKMTLHAWQMKERQDIKKNAPPKNIARPSGPADLISSIIMKGMMPTTAPPKK